MAKRKDAEDVAATIQRSIEVSPKGSRRVRCHTLRSLFGFQTWTAQRKELVASLLEGRGIHAQPPVSETNPLSLPGGFPPPLDTAAHQANLGRRPPGTSHLDSAPRAQARRHQQPRRRFRSVRDSQPGQDTNPDLRTNRPERKEKTLSRALAAPSSASLPHRLPGQYSSRLGYHHRHRIARPYAAESPIAARRYQSPKASRQDPDDAQRNAQAGPNNQRLPPLAWPGAVLTAPLNTS
jgi:hypothetical protein